MKKQKLYMESLVTASLGIFCVNHQYYLQIIVAETEQHYFVSTKATTAHRLSQREGIEIWEIDQLPPGFLLNG
jgi:hypothetical protein